MDYTETPWPIATWLRDERYGLRAPMPEDAGQAGAWHEGPFPITVDSARDLLARQEMIPWGTNPTIRLVVSIS